MRLKGLTAFLLYVAQCITFNEKRFFTATIIAEASLKSLYSRLGFKVIKYFTTSPNFENSRKQINYESGKSNKLHKKIGLKFHLTIPRRVTNFYGNRIELNENKDVFKD